MVEAAEIEVLPKNVQEYIHGLERLNICGLFLNAVRWPKPLKTGKNCSPGTFFTA
jgi:hypothetical protein